MPLITGYKGMYCIKNCCHLRRLKEECPKYTNAVQSQLTENENKTLYGVRKKMDKIRISKKNKYS